MGVVLASIANEPVSQSVTSDADILVAAVHLTQLFVIVHLLPAPLKAFVSKEYPRCFFLLLVVAQGSLGHSEPYAE